MEGDLVELQRNQEVVEHYHYDFRLPEDKSKTEIKVGFAPLKGNEDYPKENSILGARINFKLVFANFIISGSVSQINHVINRKIEKQEDLTTEEINEIAAPLFKIIERLTYEVTEIALDKPGVKLDFLSKKQNVEDDVLGKVTSEGTEE